MKKTVAQLSKTNPNKFWQYVKSNTKTTTGIPDLRRDEHDLEAGLAVSDKEKSQVLNDFYSSVFTQEPVGTVP